MFSKITLDASTVQQRRGGVSLVDNNNRSAPPATQPEDNIGGCEVEGRLQLQNLFLLFKSLTHMSMSVQFTLLFLLNRVKVISGSAIYLWIKVHFVNFHFLVDCFLSVSECLNVSVNLSPLRGWMGTITLALGSPIHFTFLVHFPTFRTFYPLRVFGLFKRHVLDRNTPQPLCCFLLQNQIMIATSRRGR